MNSNRTTSQRLLSQGNANKRAVKQRTPHIARYLEHCNMPVTIHNPAGNINIRSNQPVLNAIENQSTPSCSSDVALAEAEVVDEDQDSINEEDASEEKRIPQVLLNAWRESINHYINEAEAIKPPNKRIDVPSNAKSPVWLAGVMIEKPDGVEWKCMYDGCPGCIKIHRDTK